MKKILSLILVTVLLLGLAACGKEKKIERDLGSGFVLRQGIDEDHYPFAYLNADGSAGGFDVALCKAVCEYNGWGYEAVAFSLDGKEDEIKGGTCDCIWTGMIVEDFDEDDYLWSAPYLNCEQVIIVRKDSGLSELRDLVQQRVGVQSGSPVHELFTHGKRKELFSSFRSLVTYKTCDLAFAGLRDGEIEAFATDAATAAFMLANSEDFKLMDEVLYEGHCAVAFLKGDDALCAKVNEALKALAEDGTLAALAFMYPELQGRFIIPE